MRVVGIFSLFLIFCICCVMSGDDERDKKRCGIHEEYNDCGVYWWCERTCDEPNGQACPKICVPGCFCETGFIRKRANGTCICEDDCPGKC